MARRENLAGRALRTLALLPLALATAFAQAQGSLVAPMPSPGLAGGPTGPGASLTQLHQAALIDNPLLRRRQTEIVQAEASVDMARSRLLPQISVDYTRSPHNIYTDSTTNVDQSYMGSRRTVQLRQALFDLASWHRISSEAGRVRQAEQALQVERLGVAGNLVDRYLAVLEAEDETTRIASEKNFAQTQLERVRLMRERQMAKITDLYQVEAYLAALRSQELDAAANRAVALQQLREITGVSVEAVRSLGEIDPAPGSRTMDDWQAIAIARSPALAALRHQLESARALVTASRAQHAPTVALVASRVNSNQGYDNRLAPPYASETLAVQFSLPLYSGGQVEATVRDAIARQDAAELQLEQTRRELVRQVTNDFLHARTSLARIQSTREEVRSQEQLVESQERAYSLGAATLIDVLDARRRLLKSRADHARSRYDLLRDLAALRLRTGELDEDGIREIDAWFGPQRLASR